MDVLRDRGCTTLGYTQRRVVMMPKVKTCEGGGELEQEQERQTQSEKGVWMGGARELVDWRVKEREREATDTSRR